MKKFLLSMMLLAMAVTSVNAQNLTTKAKRFTDFNAIQKVFPSKVMIGPKKAESTEESALFNWGYDGADGSNGYYWFGLPDWESASMIMSAINSTNIKDFKGYKLRGLSFAVHASLGDNAAIAAFVTPKGEKSLKVAASKTLSSDDYQLDYWNTIEFSEPYTFTGEEEDFLYGYQYTQKQGNRDEVAAEYNPVFIGESNETVYNDMFLIYGQPTEASEEGIYIYSDEKYPYVPCILLLLEAPNGETAIVGINGADKPITKQYFSLGGEKLTAPQKGVNIVKMSDGTTKKVVIK